MRSLQRLLICGMAVTVVPTAVTAQYIVRGTVTDPAGALIPGATVTMQTPQPNAASTRTGPDGKYKFDSVAPGNYLLTATANGFEQVCLPTRVNLFQSKAIAKIGTIVDVGLPVNPFPSDSCGMVGDGCETPKPSSELTRNFELHVAAVGTEGPITIEPPPGPAPLPFITPLPKWPLASESPASTACAICIRAELSFLASDAMRGRGSGTPDELTAATYVGSELMRYGVEPAGDNSSYVQTATVTSQTAAAPPVLTITNGGQTLSWTHGKEFIAQLLTATSVSGPLQKIATLDDIKNIKRGAAVLLPAGANPQNAGGVFELGAAIVMLPASPRLERNWQRAAAELPEISNATGTVGGAALSLNADAAKALAALPDGATIKLDVKPGPVETSHTYNALGIIRGSDPVHSGEVVLLTAHLDHLGIGQPVNGDDIYNGADDDASGTVAVLQMARALGASEGAARPKRTVVFALFGSEEKGGVGSDWFLQHPPVALNTIVANLEFEMIGRADAAVKPDELWLTGWERSNLGPTLAQHGAKLVGDPHPQQHFFERSDNIVLAKTGVVAQTVSSYGLHPQYHRPDDDLAHINWEHMDQAIGSMIEPVRWLVNSDFKPEWLPGKKP